MGGVDEREEDEGADALVLAVGDGDAEEEEDAGEDEVHGQRRPALWTFIVDTAPTMAPRPRQFSKRCTHDATTPRTPRGRETTISQGDSATCDDAGRHVQTADRAEAVPRLTPSGDPARERGDARGVGPDPVPSRHRVQGRVQALAEVRVLARRDRHPDGNAHGDRAGDDARRRRARLDRDHLDGDGHEAFNAWMSDGGHCGQDAFVGGHGRAAESGLARVLREARRRQRPPCRARDPRGSARARHRASLITSYSTFSYLFFESTAKVIRQLMRSAPAQIRDYKFIQGGHSRG